MIGDKVYLKIRPYRQRSLARRRYEKLVARFYGPFEVVGKVGAVTYRLALPETTLIHPVFHVSQLRRAIGPAQPADALPAELTDELELIVEPERLLGIRSKSVGQAGEIEVLIKWRGLVEFEASWEDFDVIHEQFPDFHLEDKVEVWRGSIVRPPVQATYRRRA